MKQAAIFRILKQKSGPATALVKFTSEEVRNRRMAASSKLRGLTHGKDHPLSISQRTLPDQIGSFFVSRALDNVHSIEFLWVKDGGIFTRVKEADPAIRIHQRSALERL